LDARNEVHADRRSPVLLRVAAAICWLWGLGTVLVGFIELTLVLRMGVAPAPMIVIGLVVVAVGVLYCLAGRGLQTGRPYGGIVAVIVASAMCVIGVRRHTENALLGLVPNVAIIVLIVVNRRSHRVAGG
jgi:hypothetical protein